MHDLPVFRKPDRYKASSYRSYNFKMPSCYDTMIWTREAERWNRLLLDQLGTEIGSLEIVDVGCATGRLLEAMGRAGATRLSGIDLAPRILDVAAERLARAGIAARLCVADAEDRLPWDDGSFDLVTMTAVFHHFFRPGDALVEIRRVLRPGGRLLLLDPCFFPLVRQILNVVLWLVPHDGDCHFHSRSGAARLLAGSGFDVRAVRQVGLGVYLADCRKPAAPV